MFWLFSLPQNHSNHICAVHAVEISTTRGWEMGGEFLVQEKLFEKWKSSFHLTGFGGSHRSPSKTKPGGGGGNHDQLHLDCSRFISDQRWTIKHRHVWFLGAGEPGYIIIASTPWHSHLILNFPPEQLHIIGQLLHLKPPTPDTGPSFTWKSALS